MICIELDPVPNNQGNQIISNNNNLLTLNIQIG